MFDEDLAVFFNTEEFSSQIVVRNSGEIISGIIDRDYIDIDGISGSNPLLFCATDDISKLKRGDVIEHGDDSYRFIFSEPDGTGVSRSKLEAL